LTLLGQRRSVAPSTLDLYTGIARELGIRLNQLRKWRLECRENATLREKTT
jgi:transposase-like protein